MAHVVTDAIVLHSFDYLESSRILRLVTREVGVSQFAIDATSFAAPTL